MIKLIPFVSHCFVAVYMYFSCSQALLRSYKYITRYKTKASLERDINFESDIEIKAVQKQCNESFYHTNFQNCFYLILSQDKLSSGKGFYEEILFTKVSKKKYNQDLFSPFTVSRFFTKTYLDLFCWTLRRSLRSLFTFDFA